MVPFLPKPPSLSHYYSFGFGYDEVSRDYKFVRILQFEEGMGTLKCQVMVYSFKMDSWVMAPDVPLPFFPYRDDGVPVNGTLHWENGSYNVVEKSYSIVAFNLSDHCFSEVLQPTFEEAFINLCIGVLDGFLCLMVNKLDDSDIWIMKEYGVVGSWTRLFKVKLSKQHSYLERPIAYSLNSRNLFLLLNTWRVVSLDLQTMAVKDVKLCDFPRCFDPQVCIENLVMLKDSGREAMEIDHQWDKKRKRFKRMRKNQPQRRNNSIYEIMDQNMDDC